MRDVVALTVNRLIVSPMSLDTRRVVYHRSSPSSALSDNGPMLCFVPFYAPKQIPGTQQGLQQFKKQFFHFETAPKFHQEKRTFQKAGAVREKFAVSPVFRRHGNVGSARNALWRPLYVNSKTAAFPPHRERPHDPSLYGRKKHTTNVWTITTSLPPQRRSSTFYFFRFLAVAAAVRHRVSIHPLLATARFVLRPFGGDVFVQCRANRRRFRVSNIFILFCC